MPIFVSLAALQRQSGTRTDLPVVSASLLLRRLFALLILLSASLLPSPAHADDEEGCIPSPEDGIFCGEDPPPFVLFGAYDAPIYGDVTEAWDAAANSQTSFSYHHGGGDVDFYRYALAEGARLSVSGTDNMIYVGTVSGSGSFRLLAGTLRFNPSGSYVNTDSNNVAYYSLNTYTGGTEVAGGRLRIYDDGSLGGGALALSGTGQLETIDGGSVRGFSVTGTDAALVTDADLTVTGAITGDGRFNKLGSGTVSFSGTNTYTGGTQVGGGSLSLGNDSDLGAADTAVSLADGAGLILAAGFASSNRALELADGTATLDVATGTATWSGATSGAGAIEKTGAGTLVLPGETDHTGGAHLGGGTLEVAVSTSVGVDGSTTWSGAVTGSGRFVKSGAGTLVLSGAASHTGATLVQEGTLRAGADNVLSAGSALFLINGAQVDLAGHDQTLGDLDSYDAAHDTFDAGTLALGGATLTTLTRVTNIWAGAITGEGNVIKEGASIARWSGANTFAGTLTIAAGTLQTTADGTLSRDAVVSVSSGATLDLAGHAQTVAGLAGGGTVTLGSGSLTVAQDSDRTFFGALSGTGAVVKSGTGTLTFSGTQDFSGGLTLAGGTVSVASDASLGAAGGSIAFAGGTLTTTATFTSARDLALIGAGTIRTDAGTLTLSGTLAGSGALTKTGSGTLVVSGSNAGFTGATAIEAGTLTLGHATALGQAGAVSIASGATLNSAAHGFDVTRVSGNGLLTGSGAFSHDSSSDRSLATMLAGTGGLTKSGSGTLTLTGASTYTGVTTIAAGRLIVDGSIANSGLTTVAAGATLGGSGSVGALTIASGGTLAPGNSPGTLTAGDTVFAGGGTFDFQINAANGVAGTQWNLLSISGTLDLTGLSEANPFHLSITSLLADNSFGALADFDRAQSYAWIFVETSGGISGFFADGFAIDTTSFLNARDGTWSVTSDGHTLSLAYTTSAIPEPSTYAGLAGLAAWGLAAWRRRAGKQD